MVHRYVVLILLVSLFILIAYPQVALSEHEADHRYTVMGYVLDSQKQGIENSSVKVLLNGRLVAQKTTDSRGFYKAKLHVHDADYGKELEIITRKGSGKVKINFTLGDKKTERLQYINFINGQLSEGELSVPGFPRWVYFAAVGLLVLIIVIAIGSKKKGEKKSKQKKKKN